MQYVSAEENETIEGGAILHCSHSWSIDQLSGWLDGYDYDMLTMVKKWLACDAHIAEGMFLKVWVD